MPELVRAMAVLDARTFTKAVAFRFTEKSRYKWRRRKWVVRFVLLALDRGGRAAADLAALSEQAARAEQQQPSPPSRAAG